MHVGTMTIYGPLPFHGAAAWAAGPPHIAPGNPLM